MRGRSTFCLLICTSFALAVLAVSGCTTRRHASGPYPATLPPDQQVEVWNGSTRTVLRHVTIDSVAVRGQSVTIPACDSLCAITIPRIEADSVVLVNHDTTIGLLGIAGFLTFFILNHCHPGFVSCY